MDLDADGIVGVMGVVAALPTTLAVHLKVSRGIRLLVHCKPAIPH